ncbi:MAG: hypothetical protein MUC29_05665 [Pyrinomonadaceae bacterium]|jgi:hypothetical protein|nr:hypothetical protein [Pyrinomonadaceae bacterium]
MKSDLIIFILVFIASISNFIIFNVVLKIQKSKYQDIWKDDGSINGFFTFDFSLSNAMKRGSKFLSWIFVTDDWMKNESKVIWLLRIIRFNFLLFISVCMYVIVNLIAK